MIGMAPFLAMVIFAGLLWLYYRFGFWAWATAMTPMLVASGWMVWFIVTH